MNCSSLSSSFISIISKLSFKPSRETYPLFYSSSSFMVYSIEEIYYASSFQIFFFKGSISDY